MWLAVKKYKTCGFRVDKMSDIKIYDFMKYRKYALIFSSVMLVVSIWSLATKGLVLGLDFSGGTQIEVGYETPADVGEIRNNLEIRIIKT